MTYAVAYEESIMPRPSYVRNMYPLQKRTLFLEDGEKVLS